MIKYTRSKFQMAVDRVFDYELALVLFVGSQLYDF